MEFVIEEVKKYHKSKHGNDMIFDCNECGERLDLPYYVIWRKGIMKNAISTICCKVCKKKIEGFDD